MENSRIGETLNKEGIMNYQEAYEKLEKYGQLHVLKYYDEL